MALPLAGQAFSEVSGDLEEVDQEDLVFTWDLERAKLRVGVRAADGKEPFSWEIDRRNFGPDARIALRVLDGTQDRKRYRLRVQNVAYGRLSGREISFVFDQQRVGPPVGKPSLPARRFCLVATCALFSGEAGPASIAPFRLEAFGERPRFQYATVLGARPVDLERFCDEKNEHEFLRQTIPAQRAANTFALLFGGQVALVPGQASRTAFLTFSKDQSWSVDTPNSRPFWALHPDLRLFSLTFRWDLETRSGADSLALVGEGEAELSTSATLEISPSRGPVVILGLGTGAADKAIREERRVPLKLRATVSPDEAGSEVAAEGTWSLAVAGSPRAELSAIAGMRGSLVERVSSSVRADDAFPAAAAGKLSFEARLAKAEVQAVETPVGQVWLKGLAPEAAEARAAATTLAPTRAEGFFEPDAAGTASITWSWKPGAGSRERPQLDWLEVNALMTELAAALEGADFSRLSFKPADLVIYYSPGVLEAPVRASALRLGAPFGDTLARICLDRATLRAVREVDLTSLGFEFSDLWLLLGGRQTELVALNNACFSAPWIDGRGELQALQTEPILVVEFPGQHVFEECLFLQKLPPLPDVLILSAAEGEGKEPAPAKAHGIDLATGKLQPLDENAPADLERREGSVVVDPNSPDQILEALSLLADVRARKSARMGIRELKEKSAAAEAALFAVVARNYERTTWLSWLPADQRVYVGGFGLDADAMSIARRVYRLFLERSVATQIEKMLEAVDAARAKLIGDATPGGFAERAGIAEANSDFQAALRLEGMLEASFPAYQAFRNFYREAQTDRCLKGDGELRAAEIEYVGITEKDPAWLAREGLDRTKLRNRAADARREFARTAARFDPLDVIDRETQHGLVEGRLARPSRLAFRVRCREGIEALRPRSGDADTRCRGPSFPSA